MVSTMLWLPKVSRDGDRFEAAAGFLLLSSVPMLLAIFVYVAYRLTETVPTDKAHVGAR
jgi:hypothetical protein